jgi:hydroxymethylbilane synthase
MKDVPTISQEGLSIEAVLKREDPRDAFISYKVSKLTDLPHKAIVGTASIRRRAQLSAIRPDIQFSLLRGNVGTRINKLKNGDCDATFLAVAGLNRLGEQGLITETIESDIMLSAPAQGAIGIEIRKLDTQTKKIIASLNHYETEISIAAERSFLRALDGSCKTPIAALANYKDKILNFRGEVISKDGTLVFSREVKQKILGIDEAISLGYKLGIDVREEIGKKILWD